MPSTLAEQIHGLLVVRTDDGTVQGCKALNRTSYIAGLSAVKDSVAVAGAQEELSQAMSKAAEGIDRLQETFQHVCGIVALPPATFVDSACPHTFAHVFKDDSSKPISIFLTHVDPSMADAWATAGHRHAAFQTWWLTFHLFYDRAVNTVDMAANGAIVIVLSDESGVRSVEPSDGVSGNLFLRIFSWDTDELLGTVDEGSLWIELKRMIHLQWAIPMQLTASDRDRSLQARWSSTLHGEEGRSASVSIIGAIRLTLTSLMAD